MKKNVQSLNLGHWEFNVDGTEGSKIAQEYNVRSLPTFMVLKGMEPKDELNRAIGLWPVEKIKEII
jgi:thioredoxin-like negative regulator of GroEL